MQDIPRRDVLDLMKLISSNQLLNKQLSTICQQHGLTSSGVKASLQNRINNLIQETVNRGDIVRFRQIEQSARTQRTGGSSSRAPPTKSAFDPPPPSMPAPQHRGGSYHGHPPSGSSHTGGINDYRGGLPQLSLSFKPSPFYEVQYSIGSVRTCEAMSHHRNMIPISVRVSDHPLLDKCVSDKSMRIMLFCAGDKHGPQNIAFPHQSEVKVNGGEVKANLRGLKNKPGSTRPVDITDYLRLSPRNYENRVELVYALTQKPFFVGLYLCKVTSVQDLVAKISAGKRIPKSSVTQEITKKAADADIVTTSQVLSLKCPLSCMRIDVPCRSQICTHIQCFDATSYLQLQEHGPQWLCPICSKPAGFETLAVDEYVKDILANTSRDLDQVTIHPDAQWRMQSSQDDRPASKSANNSASLDDDGLEISEVSVIGNRQLHTPARSVQSVGTPTTAGLSRDGSSLPRGQGSVSRKRPQEVVDLTLSSDEEDGPPPAKKQFLPLPSLPQTRYH